MDELEKLINKNKDELDILTPKMELWTNISKEINPTKPAIKRSIWKNTKLWSFAVAASVLFVFFVPNLVVAEENDKVMMVANQYDADFSEAQLYYQNLLESKMSELNEGSKTDEELLKTIFILEESYEQLTQELLKAPKSQGKYIVSAMMKNLTSRIELVQLHLDAESYSK